MLFAMKIRESDEFKKNWLLARYQYLCVYILNICYNEQHYQHYQIHSFRDSIFHSRRWMIGGIHKSVYFVCTSSYIAKFLSVVVSQTYSWMFGDGNGVSWRKMPSLCIQTVYINIRVKLNFFIFCWYNYCILWLCANVWAFALLQFILMLMRITQCGLFVLAKTPTWSISSVRLICLFLLAVSAIWTEDLWLFVYFPFKFAITPIRSNE